MFQSAISLASEHEPAVPPLDAATILNLVASKKSKRISLVGGFAPRQCGIATFTTDIYQSLTEAFPETAIDVYPMVPPAGSFTFADPVRLAIRENDVASFASAAAAINASNPDVIWLQHEFGLFGGDAGDKILGLVDAVAAPLIVTFHTVLADPDFNQMRVMRRLVERASKIIVMSNTSEALMRDVYGASLDQLAVVPHGAPDRPFGRSETFKKALGLEGRRVLMTFGLLSPGKGIEHVIAALPHVVEQHPDVMYCVVGATHPNLIAREGERYRDSLHALAEKLGVSANVIWVDDFLSQNELLDYIEAADIYVTPYLGASQATSGTLAYAVALGKGVISTPYLHASELLADGHGIIFPFGDTGALSTAIEKLLDDPDALLALQRRAYERGRTTIWPTFAATSMALIDDVVKANAAVTRRMGAAALVVAPSFDGIHRLSDDTGMLQHSCFSIPDRRHGYCIDDNARALMLMNRVQAPHARDADRLSGIYASFVQYAWNDDTQCFRNFMSFSRQWLEDVGSEDSNGRTLWALASTAREGRHVSLRTWARKLYDQVAPTLSSVCSPRSAAFAGLAADQILSIDPDDIVARAIAERTGEFLMQRLHDARRPDWHWFETSLAYDNCRLPEALLRIGSRLDRPDMIVRGIETLEWIVEKQMTPGGMFRPVGSDGFGADGTILPFDQQPVEVWATIDAADAAFAATGDGHWIEVARTAYQWFFGANDRGVMLADDALGTCRDGITPRGENLNEGAESTLAFHLSHAALRSLFDKVASVYRERGSQNAFIG